ncbi:DUF6308 family protein [Micromonospora rifamycinica]|uniref:DUF6308 family protein n=1 Tax=Micromonospora rifamycinica TaxID=291594 RepID=UPI0033FEE807
MPQLAFAHSFRHSYDTLEKPAKAGVRKAMKKARTLPMVALNAETILFAKEVTPPLTARPRRRTVPQPLTLAEMLAVLDIPRSVSDLRRYYLATGDAAFTGGQFDHLGGGGDRPETAGAITADDLVAVELLGVRVPPRSALDLLQGPLGERVGVELARIPVDVALGTDKAYPLVVAGGAADTAWRALRDADGIGWVIAGKLLARKRPRLVPVYDAVVSCAYRTGTGFWEWLHGRLREEDGVLGQRLRALHEKAGLPEAVSPLRVLDVVFWMRHRPAHSNPCTGIRLP